MTVTFNQLTEYAKRTALMQGRQFTDPMDDWTITVLVVHPGDERPHTIRLPGWVSNDRDAKEALGEALGLATRVTKPIMVAMIQSAWVVTAEDDPDRLLQGMGGDLAPRDHPNRKENLVIWVLDTEVTHYHSAPIHRRRRRPPVLGPWGEPVTDGDLGGLIGEPIREALR